MNVFKGMQMFRKTKDKLESSSEPIKLEEGKDDGSSPKGRRWLTMLASGVVITTGLIFAGNEYINANKVPYYKVYVQDQEIGKIKDKEQLEQLFNQKREEYQSKYPDVEMVLQTEGITTQEDVAFLEEVDSSATLQKIDGMLKAYAKGVEMKVDGKVVAILRDQKAVDEVLKQVKQEYLPVVAKSQLNVKKMSYSSSRGAAVEASVAPESSVQSVKIGERIDSTPAKVDPNKVLSAEDVAKLLVKGEEAPVLYTVAEGDTISSIAKRYSVTEKELYLNNPEIKEKYLQIGDSLKLTIPKSPLTVTTVEQISEEVVTEPKVEIRKSSDLPAGKTKVVRSGREGLKVMEYLVTKENGQVVNEQWLGQEVINESLTEVVLQGTKIIGQGSGQFAWPVNSATITSTYGSRWGKTHKGIDVVSGNRTIMASDSGIVTFTGTISGYGNAVIINHSNGYTTLYGHLSRITVNQGEAVDQGKGIGIMGNTGRSTGTHLHFEILKNNVAQNPMKYLE
ncbi:M23 family metallopeptidase [Paenibacillus sp. IHBB 10380]|uniref:M23 family metallopeptidase n=1 Tax=Paenibacillus sp. IHBB 10380 TaxID=1566358 RepID=UPI0005CFA74F|nr:M23 family metallopeptidase [Paenibacillus sp. IHBB 10380]AJS60667.1 membrane protein [Paenibacillus sp. IHBB 10380]